MAPSILQLEVSRIARLLHTVPLDLERHNALVRVRYAMNAFIECVESAEKETVREMCEPLLTQALMNVPEPDDSLDVETTRTIEYIVDRLTYVIHRIPLIY